MIIKTRSRRSLWVRLVPGIVVVLVGAGVVSRTMLASAEEKPLSQGKPVIASSIEGGHFAAAKAVDGDNSTRWSSSFTDPQWLQVDLGAPSAIRRVVLRWERAYAKAYTIEVSADAENWTTAYATTTGAGGTQDLALDVPGRYVRLSTTARATGYGVSLWEFQVYGSGTSAPGAGSPAAGGTPTASASAATAAPSHSHPEHAGPLPGTPANGQFVLANPPVTDVVPSTAKPPRRAHREFQANCSVSHTRPDDPIVFPNQPGASHDHTFMGNTTTNAASTTASLQAGNTRCVVPGDRSAYWMPTLFNGDRPVLPNFPQVIYYKSGVDDYTSVQLPPTGLRFVVGSPTATAAEFRSTPGYAAGWECGDSYHNIDFPKTCPSGTQLNIRYQAPSCWNGLHLDTPDHKSHMAYPASGVCPKSHPVAVPMIEFKMAFPVSGDMSKVRLSSGAAYSFHYDFFNAWEPPILAALVRHCIHAGRQCNARGFDEFEPGAGAALGPDFRLP
jgi:hypothetical protein